MKTVASLIETQKRLESQAKAKFAEKTASRSGKKTTVYPLGRNGAAKRIQPTSGGESEMLELAKQVFGNSKIAAEWFSEPNSETGGLTPREWLPKHADAVRRALLRIQYGVLA